MLPARFRYLRTGTKLTAAFLAVALIILIVAGAAILTIRSVHAAMSTMYRDRLLAAQQVGRIDEAQAKIQLALHRAVLRVESPDRTEREVVQQVRWAESNLKAYEATYLVPREVEDVAKLKALWTSYQQATAEALRKIRDGQLADVLRSLDQGGSISGVQDSLSVLLDELVELQVTLGRGLKQGADRTYALAVGSMSAVAVPGLLLAFLLGLALSRSITAPLAKITAVASAAAAGDLDARPLAAMANRGDEIGTLADTFANMTTQLKETLDGLHQSRAELEERVVARTGELKQSNEQLAAEVEERRRAEAMLTLRSQELLRSNSELEQFAYVASHDLQEPLRMVTSYMQLLERRYREKLDSDAREFIGFAVDGAKRMRVLIEDLLSYSRIATRGQPFRPTDCERVLEAVEGSLRVAIQESGARVTHGQLPTVVADPTQLQQLFQNLISNAIKFRRNVPPEVHVEAGSKDDSWCFSVRDNGIGIEPRFFDRIFVVFQRLHSRTAYPGTGIGLAICKKIVERHGGSIWVDSELGVGTTFHFTIPKKGALS